MWCDLPKVLNTCTKWISVVIPLGPASNPFGKIFLDTLLVIEVWILVARIIRQIQLHHLCHGKVVIIGKVLRIHLFSDVGKPRFWVGSQVEIIWVMYVEVI